VGTRIAAGGTVGAIPAGVAIAAATGGCVVLTAVFAALALLCVAIVPLAPYVPGLQRVPLIGSPRVEVHLKLDGRANLKTTLGEAGEQVSILEVGVRNRERWTDVKGAWLNLLLPSGIKVYRSDRNGQRKEGGGWEEFAKHQLGEHPRADYWNDMDWTFPANLSRVIRFKLRFTEPGDYPLLFKLGASSLHEGIEQPATMHVADGAPDLHARLGAQIVAGEALLSTADRMQEDELRVAVIDWLYAARTTVDEIGGDRLPKRDPKTTVGMEHLKELIRIDVASLYVLRDELGRSGG
jgi:hypothetical protein